VACAGAVAANRAPPAAATVRMLELIFMACVTTGSYDRHP
jgi:hypothetical protein